MCVVCLIMVQASSGCSSLPSMPWPGKSQTDRASGDQAANNDGVAGGIDVDRNRIAELSARVDSAQAAASKNFLNFMSQVDGFFSDSDNAPNEGKNENDSWARIRLDVDKPGDDSVKVGGSLKLRAVLPRTERRFRLLLSTEDDDTESIGGGATRADVPGESGGDVSLALRFIRTARDSGSLNFDIGVRQRDKSVQYFGRINNTFEGNLTRDWYGKASNSYYYYSKSGFADRLRFDVLRNINQNEKHFFRSATEFNWEKGQKGAVIGETLGVYVKISDRSSLAVEGIASYHTALNDDTRDRYRGSQLRLRWRQNIWRPWFFYEVWPAITWLADNDYESAFAGLLRMEVVVGQH